VNGDRTRVYTDGACSGNPGPGGWAWIVPDGPFAAGPAADTTNQRMELQAVLDAVTTLDGPLHVVSDSTYVVNCFRDEWWKGWRKRGWLNSQKKPVANRDLWEPLIDAVTGGDVEFEWVKGHAGDRWNDYADRLAVEAAFTQKSRTGAETPTEIGEPDKMNGPARVPGSVTRDPTGREAPTGHRLVVLGLRPRELGGYDATGAHDRLRRTLREIIAAKGEMHPDLVVMTGLRLGAELIAGEAAVAAGARLVAVLPYPDPQSVWPTESQRRFAEIADAAEEVITLQAKVPTDQRSARGALGRRNSWFVRNSHEAIVVWDHDDAEIGKVVASLQAALGEGQVWVVEPEPHLAGGDDRP
jgi:ribonuclease HI